ncbi:tripartite tricarboxylate transporter substrate binding protein [Pigmentiphaga soli]|uniref:Tripartite tricarboxylate transporter substrate binding protein n=1 Tax=Pigmentiphaga soli TaxID=1007095 RepID=A0ABP8HAT7_9BURK
MFWRIHGTLAAAVLGGVLAAGPALAQQPAYPSKPITLVVPYGPGGPADTAARLVADIAGRSLGQPVVIENRPGAATKVAAAQFVRAPKDGYTLLECTSSTFLTAALARNPGFGVPDFLPVSLIASNPFVLSVTAELPVRSAPELVAYAKAHPGKLNLGSLGAGSVEEIMGLWFAHSTGISIAPIAYKGGLSAAIQDLIAGRVHLMFDAIGNSTQYYRAGRLRILGVATAERVDSLPEVPTLAEQGLPFVNGSWLGICAPAGVPAPVAERISREIVAAVRSDEYQSKIRGLGFLPVSSDSSASFLKFTSDYLKDWAEMTRTLGITLE